MTPDDTFRTAVEQAMDPARGAAPKPVVPSPADAAEISEEKRQLFKTGLRRMATLPDIPFLPVPTTPRSPWYRRRCAECRHTFRVGDRASTCPRCGRAYHWNPIQGLDCLGVVFDNEEGQCICRGETIPEPPLMPDMLVRPEQMSAFVGGLAREWSAYGEHEPVVVTAELEGLLCAVCGHTVRLREKLLPPHRPQGPRQRGGRMSDRYHRQRLLEEIDQERLTSSSVLLLGAGALGNEVLSHLAAAGIGHLVVVDFDHVELTNLHRTLLFREDDIGRSKARVAAREARRINPELRIEAVDGDFRFAVGLGFFRRADVVVGCVDSVEARAAAAQLCALAGVPYIDGGTHGLIGEVRHYLPGDGPCYACTVGREGRRRLLARWSCAGLALEPTFLDRQQRWGRPMPMTANRRLAHTIAAVGRHKVSTAGFHENKRA